jgi:hypothetical protein
MAHRSSVPRLSYLVKLLWGELHAHGHAVDCTRSHAGELLRYHSLPLLLLEHLLLADSSHCARVIHPNWIAVALACQVYDGVPSWKDTYIAATAAAGVETFAAVAQDSVDASGDHSGSPREACRPSRPD